MNEISPALDSVVSLSTLHSLLTKKMSGPLSIHGISFSEFLVMHQLHQSPGKTMRRIELAESVGLTASGVTRMLAPMEKIKLVEKEANPRDARVSLVKLSATGEQVFLDALVGIEDAATSMFGKLTEKQQERFSELVKALL